MANTTATTEQLRRSEIWSAQLKDVLKDELQAPGYVNFIQEFPDGDQFTMPSIGEATVRDYTENTPVVYDALDTGEFTFVINMRLFFPEFPHGARSPPLLATKQLWPRGS